MVRSKGFQIINIHRCSVYRTIIKDRFNFTVECIETLFIETLSTKDRTQSLLSDIISRSQIPPKWEPVGGLKFQLNPF